MAPKRTVVVIVAIALAVVAALLSYVFLNNAQNNAYKNAKLVSAFVVAKPIPRGLAGSNAGTYFEQKNIPSEIRPNTAITDLAALQGKEAVAPFSVGQVLVNGMFVSPSEAAVSFSHLIPAGDVAVSVQVDQVHGVASLPVPGDKVDLLVNLNNTEDFLLQNVPILAIGQSTTGQATSTATPAASSTGLFTFAVRPSDAARIAFAQQSGFGIYLLLVPPGNSIVSPSSFGPGNVLSGPQASG